MDELSLERRLVALGETLVFPRPDVLVDDVLAGIEDDADRPDDGLAGRRRRVLLAAAALVVAIAGVAAVVPDGRRAVARWLGFDALRIERVVELPETVPAGAAPAPSLDAAAETVGIVPRVADGLGPPVAVETPGGRYVAVRYDEGGRDVMIATLPGDLDEGRFGKLGTAGVDVRDVTVGGLPGYWITGTEHVFLYADDSGQIQESRPAADTLVWQDGDVIIRVEGDISLAEALEIAATVREP